MICSLCRDYKRSLAISDFIAFFLAIGVAQALRLGGGLPGVHISASHPLASASALLVALALIWEGSLRQVNAHEVQAVLWDEFLRILLGAALAALLLGTIFYSSGAQVDSSFLLPFVFLLSVITMLLRSFVPRLSFWLTGQESPGKILILGQEGAGLTLEKALKNSLGCEVIRIEIPETEVSSLAVMQTLREQRPDEVVLAPSEVSLQYLAPVLEVFRRFGVPWQLVPGRDPASGWPTEAFSFAEVPLIAPRRSAISGFNLLAKSFVDRVVGAILLVIALPFMALISLAIRLDSRGPAMLIQERVGYKRRIFRLFKFRTMHMDTDDTVHRSYVKEWIKNKPYNAKNGERAYKIVDDNRVTWVGRWLRKFSLDELPQLINVVIGDMSLVGPRPALPYEVESYDEWHKERFEGPPGLTGTWQVNGRNNLSFDDMVRLDIEYLHNWTPGRDLVLLAKTVPTVLSGTGR